MNKKSALMIVSAAFLAGNALAGTMGTVMQEPDWTWVDSFSAGPVMQEPNWTWVGSFSAGPVWENGGSTQTFYLAPGIEKSYVANQSTNTLFDGEFFLGVQKKVTQTLQGQLGFAVAATSNANLSGMIWDDADPQFNNYNYGYKIQHTHVAVKGKLLADSGFWLIPWVSGGLGLGFNQAHGFHNTPTLSEALPNPNFSSNTQTAFTYTLGAGVQKALNEHWQVGVGYEFADWGKSNLGRADGQTLDGRLGLNHPYTNGVLFNLTYLS